MYIYQDRIFKLVQNSLDAINVKNEAIRRWWLTTAIRCWTKGGYRQNLLVSSTHSRSDTYFIITYKELSQAGRTALENGEEMFAVAQSNLRMDDMQMMVRWMRNQVELGETDFSNYDYKALHEKAKRFASDRRWNMMRADAAENTHLLHTAETGATVHALTSTAALEVAGHDLLNCLREEYEPDSDKVYHGLLKRHSFIGVYYGGRFVSIAEVTLWRAHGSLITDEGRGGYELRSHLGRSNNAPTKVADAALNEWLATLGCKEKVRLPYSSTILWLKYISSAQLEEFSRENTQVDPTELRKQRPTLNISLESTYDAIYGRMLNSLGISPEVMRGIAAQESATPWFSTAGVTRNRREFPIQTFGAQWAQQADALRERMVELGRRAAARPTAFAALYGATGWGVLDSCAMIVDDDRQRAPYQPLTVAYTNTPTAPELSQGRNVRNELEARFGNRVAVPHKNFRCDARGNIKLKVTYETPGPKLTLPLLSNWRAEHAKQFGEWKEKQPKTTQPAVYGGKTAMMRELFGGTSFRFPETGIIRFLPQTDTHFGTYQAIGRATRRGHDLPEIQRIRSADDLVREFGQPSDFTVTGRLRPYQQWARDMILGPDPARVEGQLTVHRVKEREPNRNQVMILDYPATLRFD